MAYENINFTKPNMAVVAGYFFTFDEVNNKVIQKLSDGSTAFEYPTDSILSNLYYEDNFDTNTYASTLWNFGTGNAGGFRNGKFWSRGGGSSNGSWLTSLFRLKNNFEAITDFACITYPSVGGWAVVFELNNRDTSPINTLQITIQYISGNLSFYGQSVVNNVTSQVGSTITIPSTNGRMRIARSGSTTTLYYLNSSRVWTSIGTNTTALGSSNNISCQIYNGSWSTFPTSETEYDNFYAFSPLSAVKSLQYDGTYFWTLQDITGSGDLIIRKWLLSNYICKLIKTFTYYNSSSFTYSSDTFSLEHYITKLNGSISSGSNIIHLDEYYDTVVDSGTVLALGPNQDGLVEDVTVSTISGSDVILTTPIYYDYQDQNTVSMSKSFFVFNDYYGTSLSGALYRFDSRDGSYLGGDANLEYKDVTASTFKRFQGIIRDVSEPVYKTYDDVSSLIYVKNTNARFRNVDDLLSLTDAYSVNDYFTGVSGVLPDTTKWNITAGDPKLYDDALFYSTVINEQDVVKSKYLLVGDFDVQVSGSSGSMGSQVCAIDLNDDFTYSGTGGVPNTNRWIRGGTNPSVGYLDNDTLYLATTNSGASTSNVRTVYLLRGNFDVQVDFTLITYPATNTWATNLVARIGAAGDMIYISRRYESGHLFVMRTYGSSSTTIGSASSSLTTSKLRLVRSGFTTTGYYWTGSAWASLGSSTFLDINDIYIYLWQDMSGSNPTSAARYDNFKVNSVSDITLYQHIDVPVYSDYNDDFTYSGTGGVPDINKWVGVSANTYLDSNTLYMYATSSTPDAAMRTKYYLSGNFDIQIDFQLLEYPSVLDWAAIFRVTSITSGDFVEIRRGYESVNRFVLYDYVVSTQTWTSRGTVSSTLTSSKLRLVRSNSTITGYYWTGSIWTSVGTSTFLGVSDVCIYIIEANWTNSPNVSVRFDNFLVNSADSVLLDTPSYSYINGQDTTLYGGLGDTFTYSGTDGVPDSYKWTNITSWTTLDNNALLITASGTSRHVQTNYQFIGNFDVQVDYSLVTYPATNMWYCSLWVSSTQGTTRYACVGRRYENGHLYQSFDYNGSSWSNLNSSSTTDTSGKFRIIRTGSTIYLYRWNSSTWLAVGSTTLFGTENVYISLREEITQSLPLSRCKFDNFKVNYATEVSSYYCLHGMVLTFPYVSNYWCEIDKKLGVDSLSNHMVARYSKGTTTTFASSSAPVTNYMLRLKRSGENITFYYKTMVSGTMSSTWSSLGTLSMYSTDCVLSLFLRGWNVTVSGAYFDDLIYDSGKIRYQLNSIPYYGTMNMDNIRINGSTIIPVYAIDVNGDNLYRLQDEATYYGTDNDWGTNYNYQVSPIRSFVDFITVDAYPQIVPATGRNSTTITAVVKDQYGNGVINTPIDFTDDDSIGFVSNPRLYSDVFFGTGVVKTGYISGTALRTVTVQGKAIQST